MAQTQARLSSSGRGSCEGAAAAAAAEATDGDVITPSAAAAAGGSGGGGLQGPQRQHCSSGCRQSTDRAAAATEKLRLTSNKEHWLHHPKEEAIFSGDC